MQDYSLDTLVQGYPGKSVCHGDLGWSTIALLRGAGEAAITAWFDDDLAKTTRFGLTVGR